MSIKTIAAHMGVSAALVSYVLSGKAKAARISDAMATKILEKARELNYQPNMLAKGLKSGRSNTLGLIVADISNPFFSTLSRLLENEAAAMGYTLLIGSSDEQSFRQQALINAFCNRQVDGLLIAAAADTAQQIAELQAQQMPLVLIDRYFKDLHCSSVCLNNFLASKQAVNAVQALGHKTIAMVGYKTSLQHMADRLDGCRMAVKESGKAMHAQLMVQVNYHSLESDMARSLETLFRRKTPPTAVLFATNSLAIAGVRWLEKQGIRIPTQVSVIGFDESEAFEFFHSPLSYVRQNIEAMASLALQCMAAQIADLQSPAATIVIAPELILRQSTSTPLIK